MNTLNSKENQQGDCIGDLSGTTPARGHGVPSYVTRELQLQTSGQNGHADQHAPRLTEKDDET